MKMKFILSIFVMLNIIAWGLFFLKPSTVVKSIPQPTPAPVVEKNNVQPIVEIKKIANVQVQHLAQNVNPRPSANSWVNNEVNALKPQTNNLNPNILKLSLTAYQKAQMRGQTHNPLLTIIDYSKPSTEKRLWVVDVSKQKVLFNTLVAHGKNSGAVNASSFSNRPSSLKSSIGVFVTRDIYSGKHGSSLHVQGLEPGINDNAYSRSIVFHGANYVSKSIAKSGRLGRSWGCMAVSQDVIKPLINTIKNNSLVFAYYPDKQWLNHSSYLT